MDLFPYHLTPAIVSSIFLLFLYKYYYLHKTKRLLNTSTPSPPQPPGALPLAGHLQLVSFGTRRPLARALAAIADKYGAVFTIWLGVRKVMVISDRKVLKECFTFDNDRALSSRPMTSVGKYLDHDYAGFGFAPYGPYWRTMRKLAVTQILSTQRLMSLQHVRSSEVDTFVSHVYSLVKNSNNNVVVVPMSKMLERVTLNITMRMIAGKRFGYHGDGDGDLDEEWRRIDRLIKGSLRLFSTIVISDLIPFLGWTNCFPGKVKSMLRLVAEFDSILWDWVVEHEERTIKPELGRDGNSTNVPEDFIDVLLASVPDEDSVHGGHSRRNVILSSILTIILGATDTTSISMTWVLANLMKHKRVYELVLEELDQKIGRERCVEEQDIEKLVYLQAVVKETLRLYPPGPLSIPREANKDCQIDGYHVPKGTWVFVNLWKLHRDSATWSDPHEFMPERFIVVVEGKQQRLKEEFFGGNNFEYAPFGMGRRSCPGLSMASQVIHLTLAKLLQGFTMAAAGGDDGYVDMTEDHGITMQKATPLNLEIVAPRLPVHLYRQVPM